MSQDSFEDFESISLDSSLASRIRRGEIDLQDMEAVRLLLRGDSVVDWQRLNLDTLEKVDRYLASHLLDMADPRDRERLRFVYNEAVNYLEEHLDLAFPDDLRDVDDVREIFILASHYGGFRRRQVLACVVLKLMHVINHMEAADLKFQLPVSEARLIELAERRIIMHADIMRRENFPIMAFYGNRKTRNSIITKLIAKKETIATTIFDKLRFRLITQSRDDILAALVWLVRNVFPFSLVIPGQSHNNLITLEEMMRIHADVQAVGRNMQAHPSPLDGLHAEPNPFSGSTYGMINFIVDFPVRVDEFLANRDPRHMFMLGRTVFVLVEFQILDQETARRNAMGENSHQRYKERQREIVNGRLRRGGKYKQRA